MTNSCTHLTSTFETPESRGVARCGVRRGGAEWSDAMRGAVKMSRQLRSNYVALHDTSVALHGTYMTCHSSHVTPKARTYCEISLRYTRTFTRPHHVTNVICVCVQIFGTPSELVEMFDMAHVLIFLIILLFVSMIALILWRFSSFCEDWDGYELTAIDAVKQGVSPPLPIHTPLPIQTPLPIHTPAFWVHSWCGGVLFLGCRFWASDPHRTPPPTLRIVQASRFRTSRALLSEFLRALCRRRSRTTVRCAIRS